MFNKNNIVKRRARRRYSLMRRGFALFLAVALVLQYTCGCFVYEANADTPAETDMLRYAGSNKIYVGETVTVTAKASEGRYLNWEFDDDKRENDVKVVGVDVPDGWTQGQYCAYNVSNNSFSIIGTSGTTEGVPVTLTVTDSNNNTTQTIVFYICSIDSVFYFQKGSDKITTGTADVTVNGSIELKTNQNQDLNFSNSNGHVTVVGNATDGYKVTNNVDSGQKPTTSDAPVIVSSTYSFSVDDESGDSYTHKVTIKLDLHVIDSLLLQTTELTMKKGTSGHPSTQRLQADATNTNSKISWKVCKGRLTADEAQEADEVDSKAFSITATSSVNSVCDIATLTITQDLVLSADSSGNVYTVLATQTVDNGGRDMNAVCYVTVLQPVTDLQLSAHKSTLYLTSAGTNAMTRVTANLYGDRTNGVDPDENAKGVIWSCTDESVVSIRFSQNSCQITALRPGHCVVVAASQDNPDASDVMYITVIPKVSSVEITSTDMTVNLAEQYVQLFANVQSDVVDSMAGTDDYELYRSNLNKTVVWSSSNTDVATVDTYTGKVNLHSAGRVTITCASTDDQEIADSIVITVNVPVAAITLQDYFKRISVGESFTLNYSLLSNYGGFEPSNKNVEWETSDSKVATVDNDGKVTGVAGGTATILIRADDGQITATCTVEVYQAVSRIDISSTTLDLNIGSEAVLEAAVYPTTASEQTISWSSNKPEVVSVSEDGVITANAVGDPVVITAYINDKNATIKATCIVNVVVPITSISVSPSAATLKVGERVLITRTITPKDATNTTVTFGSTNPDVATVDSSGNVTAVSGGSCYITLRTANRDMMASVYVTVDERVNSIKLNKTKKVMRKGSSETLSATVLNLTATNRSVSWVSSNTKVATVTKKGVVKAKNYGTATITCRAMDGSGVKATCKITVRRYVTKLTLNHSKYTLKVNSSTALKPIFTPSNADIKKVSWSSSNKKIATVKNGVVTAKKEGICTITCKAKDGSGAVAKCRITVKKVLTDDDLIAIKKQ